MTEEGEYEALEELSRAGWGKRAFIHRGGRVMKTVFVP